MYNGLSQVVVSNQKEESISIQRVNKCSNMLQCIIYNQKLSNVLHGNNIQCIIRLLPVCSLLDSSVFSAYCQCVIMWDAATITWDAAKKFVTLQIC